MDKPESDAAFREAAPADKPPLRSWPFVTIIAFDMLLLLLLGYLAYRDLDDRVEVVNKQTAVQLEELQNRVAQLEGAQQLDQVGQSGQKKPAPKH